MSGPTPDATNRLESEDELDALLRKVEARQVQAPGRQGDRPAAIDVFRERMRTTYLPAFEEIRAKYADRGIVAEADVDEFLGGASNLKFRFTYGELALELDGTIMRGGVAFYVIRWVGGMAGAVVSGPLLRIRNLSADEFREFMVDQIRALVKDALRRA